jgi:integrase
MKLRYLSIAEAETLLAALATKSQNLHDVALLSLHCGLRFGKISALTWSCVNSEAGTLGDPERKNGKPDGLSDREGKGHAEKPKARQTE